MRGFNLILILFGLLAFVTDSSAQTSKSKPKVAKQAKAVNANNQIVAEKKPGVHMTFENEHIDIGNVKKGEIKKFDFVFTNTGTDIIEIDIVSGCDCTTLDYPKNKIFPGKRGIIHVTFDSGKKEESETVDVDMYLKNLNPKTGQRILKVLDYKYVLHK